MSGPASSPRLLRGGLLGALVFLGWFAFSLLLHGGFSIMGVADERIAVVVRILTTTFPKQLVLYILWLLTLHLAIGFALGLWAALLTRRTWARLLVVLALHALFYLRQMILAPQLFAEFWLQRGGLRADFMRALTDHVSQTVPAAALGLLALAALVGLWRATGRRGRVAAAMVLAVAALATGLPRVWSAAQAAGGSAQPNVLLIMIDSLRPDHLSGNGYRRPTTPVIDGLLPRATFFPQCYTPLPRTFPAVVSLFTGQTPPRHGVRNMFPTFEDRAFLPPALPQQLRARGYGTAMVSDFAGDVFTRVRLGFDQVRAPTFNILTLAEMRLVEIMTHLLPYLNHRAGRRLLPVLWEFAQNADPAVLTDEAIDTLDELAGEKPFFLTVFYSTTHFPFAAPYPYYKTFADPRYEGSHRYHKFTIVGRKEEVTPADQAQVNALYDGALRATDEQIGRLLDHLRRRGLAGNTLVVVLGDHGEDLYESPDTPAAHGEQLRTEYSLKTGLILLGPGIPAGRRVPTRVRLIDVAPTLAELCGATGLTAEGESIAPLFAAPGADRPVYLETGLWYDTTGSGFVQQLRLPYPDVTKILAPDGFVNHEIVMQPQWARLTNLAKHRAWIEGPWKLIRIPLLDGVTYELYHLLDDPTCRRNLAAARPDVVAALAPRFAPYLEGAR